MKRYKIIIQLLAASLMLGMLLATASGSSAKVSGNTLLSTKAKKTTARQEQRVADYDSLMQALNAAAKQLQKAAAEVAKAAEKRSKESLDHLRRQIAEASQQNEGGNATSKTRAKTIVNAKSKSVTVDNDSVWIESMEVRNGKTVKKKTVYPTLGKQVRVENDSVYFDNLEGQGSIAISSYTDTVAQVLQQLFKDVPEEDLRSFAKQLTEGADSLINCFRSLSDH